MAMFSYFLLELIADVTHFFEQVLDQSLDAQI